MLKINPDLETHFSRFRSLAITLLTLPLLTGSVPLSSTPAASSSSPTVSSDPNAPYVLRTLRLTIIFQSTCAKYGYMQYPKTGQTVFALSIAGYGSLAAMGLRCLLFGQGGHVSRRTGADKRVSGWPFGNVEAGKKKGGQEKVKVIGFTSKA